MIGKQIVFSCMVLTKCDYIQNAYTSSTTLPIMGFGY
jgi:hypothetical protein